MIAAYSFTIARDCIIICNGQSVMLFNAADVKRQHTASVTRNLQCDANIKNSYSHSCLEAIAMQRDIERLYYK